MAGREIDLLMVRAIRIGRNVPRSPTAPDISARFCRRKVRLLRAICEWRGMVNRRFPKEINICDKDGSGTRTENYTNHIYMYKTSIRTASYKAVNSSDVELRLNKDEAMGCLHLNT